MFETETKIYDDLNNLDRILERFAKELDDGCTKYVVEILLDKRVRNLLLNILAMEKTLLGSLVMVLVEIV